MQTVNIFNAKTSLSKLIEAVESGKETEIVIARHGVAVARLTAISRRPVHQRVGVAKGFFEVPESTEESNETIRRMFAGEET